MKEIGRSGSTSGTELGKCMNESRERLLPTRQSLLERLKRWDDQESWRDFFNTYWGLLYGTAVRSGLTDAEAQDVVQETVITVAKKMASFTYNPAVDSFKGYLLYLTRKQIALEYRKRGRAGGTAHPQTTDWTAQIEDIPDPGGVNLEAIWEEEWKRNMWNAALSRVKEQVALKQFQLFDLYVLKERPALEVAEALGVTVAQVYLAKHRISALLKKELAQLKTRLEEPGPLGKPEPFTRGSPAPDSSRNPGSSLSV
jgi:RNA polymerase sigma factor (sigma-70 family)